MLFVEQMKFANSFSPKRESVLQRNAFFYKKPIAGPLVNHYHIGFDDFHTFSHLIHVYQPGENARLPNAISTNYSKDVGFGAKQGLSQSILDENYLLIIMVYKELVVKQKKIQYRLHQAKMQN